MLLAWPTLHGVIENKHSTARSTFARVTVNAHTYAPTQFVIADRPQTIVWAFTLSSRTSIWRFMAIWPSVECLFLTTPVPYPTTIIPVSAHLHISLIVSVKLKKYNATAPLTYD